MALAVRTPTMTRDEFFTWAERQELRYEFDGFAPVAMVGNTLGHGAIAQNIYFALRSRLRAPCHVNGPDAGVATVRDAVRYPDAVVSCSPYERGARLVPQPLVIFEIISPTSGRIDRIVKVREYAAVPSVLRYVMVESSTAALTVLERASGDAPWTATTLTEEDTLRLGELGIEVPVAELHAGVPLTE